MNLKPLKDLVILKRFTVEQKTAAGIIVSTEPAHHSQYADVVATGPQVKEVHVGDRVMIPKWNKDDLKIDGQNYLCMEEKDIIGIMLKND